MPHVIVKLWPGKSEEKKKQLSEAITRDVMEILNQSADSVSVSMEEVSSQDWKEEVFDPDIKGRWSNLYKKPGYEY